jgi:hypothetical protein
MCRVSTYNGLPVSFSRSFGLIQKNQKIKANTDASGRFARQRLSKV